MLSKYLPDGKTQIWSFVNQPASIIGETRGRCKHVGAIFQDCCAIFCKWTSTYFVLHFEVKIDIYDGWIDTLYVSLRGVQACFFIVFNTILSLILNVNVSMCYIYRYIYVYRFIRIAYVHLESNFEYQYSISYEKVQRLALHEVLLQQCKKRQIVPIYRTPVETKKFPRSSTACSRICFVTAHVSTLFEVDKWGS